MQKETLVTISERTGFSISTVSRVLNGKAQTYRISPQTVEIIKREAEQCNYTPDLTAKGLRTKKTDTLGLLVPGIDNPFFANIANVIIHEARMHNYTVILTDSMENEDNERACLASLTSRNIDGIVVVPCGNGADYLETVARRTPLILVDRYFADTSLPYVSTDNYLGGLNATQMLLDSGHRDILCIQGPPTAITTLERVRGYRDALVRAGLASNAWVSGEDFSIQNGYIETKLALGASRRPTAIFALSNTILLGAMKAIGEAGLKIPDDISILSFDNNLYLDFLAPAITRVSQPIEEIGIIAVKLLLQIVQGKHFGNAQILLPPNLIVRHSVRVIR